MAKKDVKIPEVLLETSKDLFTSDEIELIKSKAESVVLKEKKASAEKQILKAYEQQFRREVDPNETLHKHRISLPIGCHTTTIRIDNFAYRHGFTYELTASQLRSIREHEGRVWEHFFKTRGLTPQGHMLQTDNGVTKHEFGASR